MIVVSDATPLIALAKVSKLALLEVLFETIRIPGADWIILDETKARLAADLIGLSYIGTIGIFLSAKRVGKIGEVRHLLDELRSKKFYISDHVYRSVLKQAGE